MQLKSNQQKTNATWKQFRYTTKPDIGKTCEYEKLATLPQARKNRSPIQKSELFNLQFGKISRKTPLNTESIIPRYK